MDGFLANELSRFLCAETNQVKYANETPWGLYVLMQLFMLSFFPKIKRFAEFEFLPSRALYIKSTA